MDRDASALQLESRPLLLGGQELSPLGLLGVGRGVVVYRVRRATSTEDLACKVFDASRATAFHSELAVLTAIASEAHVPGLPMLEANSPAPGPGAPGAEAQHLLLTRPVATRLEHLTSSSVLHIFHILSHLHTKLKVVHGDVEPKHLAVDPASGTVCLLDLGSAAPLSGSRVVLPEARARHYSGTLLFASDDVLSALAEGAQPAAPHPRQDMVALVKTACVMVHGTIAKAAAGRAEAVAQQLAQQPPDIARAASMVRSFWEQQLNASTAAGCVWSELVADAHNIPGSEDVALYARASQQLCGQLATLVCPG
uniref:Protein kinase domain-containing protein n=1 Tax=Chlamydomonas leiostraca TaxID=1034604 RepID=A0A7S0WMH0_9CHLO